MRTWRKLGLAIVAMIFSVGSVDAQTTLRFKFKEGDKLDYVLDSTMIMNTKVMEKDVKVQITQAVNMSWQVLKVKDEAAQVKMSFTRVKMDMDSPMGKVKIDSKLLKDQDTQAGKTLNQVAAALSNLEVTFTMDPTGEIKDLSMPEKVKAGLQTMPGADAMGDLFSEEGLKKIANGGLVLPKEPVAAGKTWKQKIDMKMPMGKVKGDMEFTYQGVEERQGTKLDKIVVTPMVKIEPAAEALFQMKVKSQEGKGAMYFDNSTGRIVEATMSQTMEMTIEVNNMSVPQTLVQNTSMKLKN